MKLSVGLGKDWLPNPQEIYVIGYRFEEKMKAIWKNHVLAESDDTVVIENNHYFPPESLKREFFIASNTTTQCPWKGQAKYYSVVVDGEENKDAAWYYPEPKQAASEIKDRVAFWRGVEVTE